MNRKNRNVPPPNNDSNKDAVNEPVALPEKGASRRDFLRSLATAGIGLATTAALVTENPLPAQASGGGGTAPNFPGYPKSWQASVPIPFGVNNLSTGNTLYAFPICGWSAPGGGISFSLYWNSQSTRTSPLGARWTHSYNQFLDTSVSGKAIFVEGDGTETTYTLSGSTYTPPVACYDSLVYHSGTSSWTLTRKNGTVVSLNSSGLITAITDLNSNALSFTYSSGLLTNVSDPNGNSLVLGYTSGYLTSITDAASTAWTLTNSGNLTQITYPSLSSTSYDISFSYSSSMIHQINDRLGKQYTYTFSGTALQTVQLPVVPILLGGTASYSDSFSDTTPSGSTWPSATTLLATWTDESSQNTVHGLDTNGRLLALYDPNGNMSVFGYDTSNNRTSTQLPSANTWSSSFDSYGNETVTQDPLGNQTVRTFNGYGQLLTETDANSNEVQYSYDSSGNLTGVTDQNGNSSSYTVNTAGQTTQFEDQESRITQYGFDTNGNPNSVTVKLNTTTGYTTNFTNDVLGRVTERIDALSRETDYTRDAWGRLTGIAFPTSGATSIGLQYDANNNITQTSDATGIRTSVFDALNRKTSLTDPRGNTYATYDPNGRLLTQTDVTSRLITNTLDSGGRLTNVNGGTSGDDATYAYTVDNQIDTVTLPNGTQIAYGYDRAGRVTSISHTLISTSAVIRSYAAVYDAGGRITSITEGPSGDVTAFTYDNAGNLLTETRTGTSTYSGTYTYDTSGRRLTAVVVTNGTTTHNGSYTYDGAGRLTQVVDSATSTTENYTWNDDGTLASAPGSGYTKLFSYDEEQRLIQIQHNTSGTVTTAYQYGYAADGGRRWKKDYIGSVWTWYPCGVACAAGALVEETSGLSGGTWTTSALYLRAGGSCSSQLIRRNSEYHHTDILGNFGAITGSTGSVLATNLLDNFGVQRYTSGSAATQWIGQGLFVEEEGLQAGNGSGDDWFPSRAFYPTQAKGGGTGKPKKDWPLPPILGGEDGPPFFPPVERIIGLTCTEEAKSLGECMACVIQRCKSWNVQNPIYNPDVPWGGGTPGSDEQWLADCEKSGVSDCRMTFGLPQKKTHV